MTVRKTAGPKIRKNRLLLVDDHAILREGFAEIINSKADLQVCGQASTAGRALDAVNRLKPDLVVVDISLQGGSGLELIKNLKVIHPRLPMLVLSMAGEGRDEGYAEISQRLGMGEGAVRMAVHRLRQRYGELLRNEIAQTVSRPEEIDEEMRFLKIALSQ